MISKKRLEELIKQGAIIYSIYGNSIKLSNNDSGCPAKIYIKENTLVKELVGYEDFCIIFTFDQLFETKEEVKDFSEWNKEFGCIEKPQYLKFSNWKQIESSIEYMRKFGLNHNDKVLARIITNDSIYYFKLCKDLDLFTFELKQTYIGEDLCEELTSRFPVSLGKATKENYILACRKCRELFLGVKDE